RSSRSATCLSTMTYFLVLADKQVAEREERLRAFNRVISHEIKNRVGAILGASGVLTELSEMSPAKRDELVEIVLRNAHEMRNTRSEERRVGKECGARGRRRC